MPVEFADWYKEELAQEARDMEVESVTRAVEADFVGCIDHTQNDLGSLEPDFDDQVAELLLTQMGSGKQHGRERRTATRKIVSGDLFIQESIN